MIPLRAQFPESTQSLAARRDFTVSSGFTLVEMLVALAVFSLIMVMLSQVVTYVLQATQVQNRQMDSVAIARRALDTMESDLLSAVVDGSATVLVPNAAGSTNLLAMATRRRGPESATDHRYLALRYATNANNELFRYYDSVNFEEANLLASIAAASGGTGRPIASGILAAKVNVVTESNKYAATTTPTENWAATSYGGASASNFRALLTPSSPATEKLPNTARALELWIAAVDSQTMELLVDLNQVAAATSVLESSDPQDWREAIDASSSLPARAKSSIRILNKRIALP